MCRNAGKVPCKGTHSLQTIALLQNAKVDMTADEFSHFKNDIYMDQCLEDVSVVGTWFRQIKMSFRFLGVCAYLPRMKS